VGIIGATNALFFDVIAATIVTELEAQSYGGKSSAPSLSWENERKIAERIKRQEEIAAKQAEMKK